MILWLVLVISGLATYFIRASFLVNAGRLQLSYTVRRALRFVPVAALTALIVPELLMPQGRLAVTLDNHRLVAGFVAVLIAWRTRNTLLTIGAGMAALWLLMIFT